MTSTQIDAAKFLLNKRIPNPPQSSEVSGKMEIVCKLPQTTLDE